MIITRSPFRISFFGGGTDYPRWFREHGGAVLATTIDKYCYISCRRLPPFFTHKHRIVYSRIENVVDIDEIEHPSVRAVLNWANIAEGLDIHRDGDLPARSGLGSSSAFTVGLAHALYALRGEMVSPKTLASDAIHIEQNLIGENVGSQDQISAAFGGMNLIDFRRDGSFDVEPVIVPPWRLDELHGHLLLLFTGFSRIADAIAKSTIDNVKQREQEQFQMRGMVDEAISILANPNTPIEAFGRLLDASWQYKRRLSDRVSTPHIDEIYEAAIQAGALGGKILGAGGGGFMLLFAKPEHHAKIRERLKHLLHVKFKFDTSGSRIVLYQPNGL
ncbi:kinase [Pararobbsia silviterrae]|uniref:Kinase n=1 Tax=Pararobbsia silviterrae TaxID=1792498 RepID=A0A494X8X8_9BURK|nr:kinase [Pararobbsia silviterrae]RKP47177.1 kinase [Pararobbsia silviterrae]